MIKAYDVDENILFSDECQAAFEVLKLQGELCIEYVAASEDEIKETNARMRDIDKVTDVLSFPYITKILDFNEENYPYDYDEEREAVVVGSIMICLQRAAEQSEEYGHSLDREMSYLFVHGLLHLLGYDHMNDEEKAEMRQKEEEILSKINKTR